MNLYLVERIDEIDYDEWNSFVVRCKDEAAALNTLPSEFQTIDKNNKIVTITTIDDYRRHSNGTWGFHGWTTDRRNLRVTYLGQAADTSVGVVLASFNAG